MTTIKAGDTILVTLPKLKIRLAKVMVKAVTQLPGKMIAIELPDPISIHNCDGFCKDKHGWWITPNEIVPAKNEEEAKRMMAEAAQLAEAEKPKQMVLKLEGGKYNLVAAN